LFTTSDSSNLDGIIANKPAEHKIILNRWDQVYDQRDLSQFVKIINDETETFKCMNLPGKPTDPPTESPIDTTTETTTELTTKSTTKPTTKPTTQPTTQPTIKPSTQPTTKPTTQPTTQPTTTACAAYDLPEQAIVYKQFFADSALERIFECIQVNFYLFKIFKTSKWNAYVIS